MGEKNNQSKGGVIEIVVLLFLCGFVIYCAATVREMREKGIGLGDPDISIPHGQFFRINDP